MRGCKGPFRVLAALAVLALVSTAAGADDSSGEPWDWEASSGFQLAPNAAPDVLADQPTGDAFPLPRKQFPAASSSLLLLGHWSLMEGTARTDFQRGRLLLRVSGTTSVTVHCLRPGSELGDAPVDAFFRVLPGSGTWRQGSVACAQSGASMGAPGALLVAGLDPAGTHDVEADFGFQTVQWNATDPRPFVIESVGLDPGDQSTLLPGPRKPVIEFVGDSITRASGISAAHPDRRTSYAAEAARLLAADHSVVALAGTGLLTTPSMAASYLAESFHPGSPPFDFAARTYAPRIVVVALGTNDRQLDRNGTLFLAAYRAFVSSLIARHAKDTVYVALTPFGRYLRSQRRVERLYIPALWQKIAAGHGARVLVLDTVGWLDGKNAAVYLEDHVHPSAEGHLYLGEKVAEGLRRIGAVDWLPAVPTRPAVQARRTTRRGRATTGRRRVTTTKRRT
ncbi:SGNH hydrolase-type esterase domain-containing protein [Hyaloraphidium curvatum]|nr:SGNH hydrolase-type esterase domain-containing protein [Hyaloraphidium curvatum]